MPERHPLTPLAQWRLARSCNSDSVSFEEEQRAVTLIGQGHFGEGTPPSSTKSKQLKVSSVLFSISYLFSASVIVVTC